MKRIITVLLANIICIIGVFCQEHVAHAIANEINVTYYANQNVVDYVSEGVSIGLQRRKIPANLLRTSISNEYTVLVDTIPSSSIWPRDFIAYYHLEIGNFSYCIVDTISYSGVPNTSDYDYMFRASNSYGSNAALKPSLSSSSAYNMFAENTYALIINAVYNEYSNYEEYWNECSFMYQTLTKRYNIPKTHVRVLMADDSNNSTISAVSTYRNSMTMLTKDLDGDGQDDINGAATHYNIGNAIDAYKTTLTHNDHLLVFIVGDSEYDPANYQMGTNGIAYLKLWNETIPPSYELPNFNYSAVNLALGLAEVQAKTTLLLDISNSDDFVSNLEEVGFQGTVITSGRDDGLAFHTTYPYGRFVFNWLCAMNYTYNIHSNIFYQLPFTADPNNNRTITLEEAFNYANSFEGSINPYYSSTPLTWGKYMSFDDVARDVDLYIRHSNSDTGNEYLSPHYNPLFGNVTWNSPDVYLRNQQDGSTNQSHDTLNLSFPGKKAYLYVKIRNDNNLNYPASGQYLHTFWTDTRNLSLPVSRFTTVDTSDLDSALYGAIGTVPIANSIPVGDSLLVCFEWDVPASIYSYKQTHGHLPPLSYVAFLSEHSTLTCNSVDWLNKYADRTKSHKYAGLKAEFTHGYGNSVGPVTPITPFMTSALNTLSIAKPTDSEERYRYIVMTDQADIHVETQEDDENIYVGLSGSSGRPLNKSVTLHVAKIEKATGFCAGGIDIVVNNAFGNTDSDKNTFDGRISSVTSDGQVLKITLSEPAVEGLKLRVERIGSSLYSNTYNFGKGQAELSIPESSMRGCMLNISIVYENKIVDSCKLIQ